MAKARFQRKTFICITKINRKNIFELFGKFINYLYKKFLFEKIIYSIYLFKYFESGGWFTIRNNKKQVSLYDTCRML